ILRRLWQAVLVLFVVSILSFLLVYLSGDPVRSLVPLDANQEDMENIKIQFGLDKPIYIQYITFVKQAFRGNLGDSFRYRQESLTLVLQRLPATLLLVSASILIAVIISIPLGVFTGVRKDKVFDHIGTVVSLTGLSIPAFWAGIILILFFAGYLKWLPPSGKGGIEHVILPAVANSLAIIGLFTRLTRSTIVEELEKEYIVALRAKGLARRTIHYKHALKNSLIPIVTVVGLQFGTLIGGSVIIETVFAWPGVGWLLYSAITMRDLPLIRAAVLVISLMFVIINLIVDILWAFIDPKIRYT
ncbi:MAG: ABC transporter permease, partial [Desulfobacteraceae bacterium]|nr:ABC transporter permease [Desulfobacteraceae bacterium]